MSILSLFAMSMMYIYVLKLVMTQIILWFNGYITSIVAMPIDRTIIVIAFAVVFVAVQSEIFLFGMILQCQTMSVVVFRLGMDNLKANVPLNMNVCGDDVGNFSRAHRYAEPKMCEICLIDTNKNNVNFTFNLCFTPPTSTGFFNKC